MKLAETFKSTFFYRTIPVAASVCFEGVIEAYSEPNETSKIELLRTI